MKKTPFAKFERSYSRYVAAGFVIGALMLPAHAIAQEIELDPPEVNVQDMLDEQQQEEPVQDVSEELPFDDGANAEPSSIEELMANEDVPQPPTLPEPVPEEELSEDIFFDAEAHVPTGEMGRKSGPKKVNPRLQPASRLVIVRENTSSGAKVAQETAAERAMSLGRYASALEIYDRLLVTNSRDPNVLMGRAVALQHLGRTDEAISAYDQLLGLRPDNVEAQVNMLGLMAANYPAVALKRLSELSEKNPEDIGIIAQLAYINARLDNTQDAIRYLGMAASMEPQNANHVYNMAVIADRAGAKKEAVSYYEQALEIDTLYGSGKTIPRDRVFERLARIR